MNKIAIAVALAIATLSSAQAQTTTPMPQKQTRYFIGMGFTGGGDEIATVEYDNGDKGDVTFGSLIHLGGGVEYRINQSLSLQASLNYHVSSEGADNGAIRFTRVPVELIGYYHTSPQWRFGVGARHVSGVKIRTRGVLNVGDFELKNTTGAILEAEYLVGSNVGIKLRYVAEKYQFEGDTLNNRGNHIGVLGNFYF